MFNIYIKCIDNLKDVCDSVSQLYEKLHGDMINMFESSVDPTFKNNMNEKLSVIKEKLFTIVKFKEDIAIEGLKTIEKVIIT